MKKALRAEVYNKCDGHCAYCGKEIAYDEMQVDHIYPSSRGGVTELFNLNPSCRSCNHYKRSEGLEGFRNLMLTLHERLAKPYINRVGIDYEIIKITPFSGKFYFEEN